MFKGNPHPISETLHAYEFGYRTQVARRVTFDFTAFRNHYKNLQRVAVGSASLDTVPTPRVLIPLEFSYTGTARVYGTELATTWNLRSNWKLTGNFAWLHSRAGQGPNAVPAVAGDGLAAVYPSHQSFVRSSLGLSRFLTMDTSLYFLSAMHGSPVAANTRLDVRFGWRVSEKSEWSFGLANLLDPQHPEFTPDSYDVRAQVPRSFYLRYTWGQ